MADLLDGEIIKGLDFPSPREDEEPSNDTGVTDTTVTAGSSPCGEVFIAPTSGRVLVMWGGRCESNANGSRVSIQCVTKTGNVLTEGDEVKAPDQGVALETNDPPSGGQDSLTAGMQFYVLEGLTPGQEYNSVVMYRSLGGGSVDIFHRHLAVIPIP